MDSTRLPKLEPLTCVSPAQTAQPVCASEMPGLSPQPPPQRSPEGIATTRTDLSERLKRASKRFQKNMKELDIGIKEMKMSLKNSEEKKEKYKEEKAKRRLEEAHDDEAHGWALAELEMLKQKIKELNISK